MDSGTGYSARPKTAAHSAGDTQSIPWVVGACVLMGLGLWLISTWLITFNFLFFTGFPVLVVGAFMILDPRMGADHA
jgi:hypothetical protein